MAFSLESDLRTVIGEVARGLGYDRLKEEQLSAIEKFIDVFVSLPTGFGIFFTYGLLPTIFDHLKGHTLIVSPLASLMVDQKARFSSICKPTVFVSPTTCYKLIAYTSLSKLSSVKLLHYHLVMSVGGTSTV